MFGDVDGDGRSDRVWVRRVGPCRFALVVRTGQRDLEASLRPWCDKPSEVWPQGFPRVIALRPMNRARGFEPEVLMWHGASNYGLRFFAARGRRLLPMRIDPELNPRNEWNVGGFAMAFSLHNCLRPHVVGVLQAGYFRRRWSIIGETYRVEDSRFVRTAIRSRKVRRLGETSSIWPNVRSDGFDRCGGFARERP